MRKLRMLFLTALLASCAFAKDYALLSNAANMLSISLDEECTVMAIMLATEKTVDFSFLRIWDRKQLKARQIMTSAIPVKGGYMVNMLNPEKTIGIIIRGSRFQWLSCVNIYTTEGNRNVPIRMENGKGRRRIMPVPETDMAVVLNDKVLPLSKEKKARLTLGSPNKQNRRDRAVIRFNLLDYIGMDGVNAATMHLQFSPFMAYYPRQIEVECLNEEQRTITIDTGFGFTTRHTATLIVPFAPKVGSFKADLDITDDVNQALQKGISSLTYRLRDCHCDQFGNLAKKPYAISLDVPGICFTLE